MEALARSGAEVRVVGGGEAARQAALTRSGLDVCEGLVDLGEAMEGCDLFVSHGSHGSVCQTLLRGVPQLLVPLYREQELTASRVEALGAGCAAEATRPAFDDVLAAALGDGALRAGARRFAERHAGFSAASAEADLAVRLDALLG